MELSTQYTPFTIHLFTRSRSLPPLQHLGLKFKKDLPELVPVPEFSKLPHIAQIIQYFTSRWQIASALSKHGFS
jgi:hypothetical protein